MFRMAFSSHAYIANQSKIYNQLLNIFILKKERYIINIMMKIRPLNVML